LEHARLFRRAGIPTVSLPWLFTLGMLFTLVCVTTAIDCKTVRIFALVANEIACTLRAKDLERGANVEWVLTHPV